MWSSLPFGKKRDESSLLREVARQYYHRYGNQSILPLVTDADRHNRISRGFAPNWGEKKKHRKKKLCFLWHCWWSHSAVQGLSVKCHNKESLLAFATSGSVIHVYLAISDNMVKLFDLAHNKIRVISGHYHFSIDILVLVTVKFQQNDTTEKEWFERS